MPSLRSIRRDSMAALNQGNSSSNNNNSSNSSNNNSNTDNFEPFLAAAVTKYVSDEDHILSFKVGQEMLITGEVTREAGQFWWKGKVDLGAEEEKFIHKTSVVRKIPVLDPKNSDESPRNSEEDNLKLKNLLQSVNLDVAKWMKIFELEQVRSVEDLETVLLEEGEDNELTREMKAAERSKFRTIKQTGEEKAKLREWISNAGLDTKLWFGIMAKHSVCSITDLMSVSEGKGNKIVKEAQNRREEEAVGRLLRLDLSQGAGGTMECLKGCGMKLPVEAMGRHNCMDALRTRLDILNEFISPLVPFAKVTDSTPCLDFRYRSWHVLTENTSEYWHQNSMTNYWAAKDNYKGPGFTYELSTAAQISGFSLRNTANAWHNDRGTNGYKLLTSMDGRDFREVYSGSLPDARNKFSSTLSVRVEMEQPVLAKFVRFDIVSFYGKGPGLHFFKAHCELFK